MESKPANQIKSPQKPLRPVDIVVIVLCLAGVIVSLNLFRIDLYATVRNLNAVPLGIISFKYNTAQRRLGNRVLWDRLRQESPIYNGDIIRTANLSEATVRFSGGREINLSENTLIQIRMHGDNAEIDLSNGCIGLSAGSADAKGGVILNVGDNRVEAGAGTALSAGAGGGGEMVLQVAEGSAVLSGSGKDRRTAQAGTAVSLSNADQNKPSVLVTSPLSNAQFLTQREDALTVRFSWDRVNLPAAEALWLEIANNRNFTRIHQTVSAAGSGARAELPPGTWYWRIRRDTGNAVLASSRLTVLYAPALALIAPATDFTYRYRLKLPRVRFQWQKIESASSYKIEVADNRRFNNPLLSLDVKGTSLESSNFGAGTWYWRVTPVYPGNSQADSASASFKIVQQGTLSAPVLISPDQGRSVNITDSREIYFSWQKENEAASYTIQVSVNRNLSSPLINEKVKDNFFVYKGKKDVFTEGRYYWAVYQTDIENSQSPLSSVHSFTVITEESVQRPVFPPNNYTIAETLLPDTLFTWKAKSTSGNRLQVSGNSDFSTFVLNERASGESFRIRSLQPGVYYWRISGKTTSPAWRFTVVPALPAPVVETPSSGAQIVVRADESFAIRWRAVDKAEYYHLRIFSGTNTKRRPLYERNVQGTLLELPASTLDNGAYSLTIQAIADEKSTTTRLTGSVREEQFSLRKLHLVSLDGPEMNAEIQGTVVLRWSTQETVGKSRLILSQNPNPSRGTPVLEIPNPERNITLPRLKEGLYYWIVAAETPDGYNISAITPRRFRALPFLLSVPAGLHPEDGWVLGPDELRVNRNIVFSWEPVDEATAYIFTLFRETESGRQQIIRTEPLRQQSWTLDDLQLLNEGDFVWQLEAVMQDRNGAIEVRGRTAENRFCLELPLPSQVQVTDTGIMYGK
ncbi:MAG: hypothetical protein LBB72_01025 [Spirochaetaceae bacterium]|nr:hypothetical protein [Spirochaetaceae bacterium]